MLNWFKKKKLSIQKMNSIFNETDEAIRFCVQYGGPASPAFYISKFDNRIYTVDYDIEEIMIRVLIPGNILNNATENTFNKIINPYKDIAKMAYTNSCLVNDVKYNTEYSYDTPFTKEEYIRYMEGGNYEIRLFAKIKN